jgi:D-3-phosphoglycerate dehydrogenase
LITTPKLIGREDATRDFLSAQGCALIEHTHHRAIDEATLLRLIPPAAALIAGLEPVTERVLAAAPQLRVVNAPGVGYDHIDVAAASRRGIAVCIAAGANHHAVAELALGLMIALARQICLTDRAARDGRWLPTTGPELWGKTLGIVGLGRVGKCLALIGRGMGMRVLATDPVWDITFTNEHGISYVPLPRLLAEADFVSLHCPLNPQTRGLIDGAALSQMKRTAYLVNTARGPVVDEAALAAALAERRIAGAGLDVFDTEPYPNNPFAEFDNVVLTPHRGGATHEAYALSLEVALQNVTRVLRGEPPLYQVN